MDEKLKLARHWIQRSQAAGAAGSALAREGYNALALEALADAVEAIAGKIGRSAAMSQVHAATYGPPPGPAPSQRACEDHCGWNGPFIDAIRQLLPWAEGNHDCDKTCDCDRCGVTRHACKLLESYERGNAPPKVRS